MSRSIQKERETKETRISVYLDLDVKGDVDVKTPVPFFNHMLYSMLFYMNCSAKVHAEDKQGFDDHHVVEDVAIVLGDSIAEILGDRRGIRRFSSVIIPMDEALVLLSLDISGRGASYVRLKLRRDSVGGLSMENVPHFLDTLSKHAGFTLHVEQMRGKNAHHTVEAVFKALGMSIYEATRIVSDEVRSTKGSL